MEIFSDHTFLTVSFGTLLLGIISGVFGSFAVLRRQSLLGDGISHCSLLGAAAAFLVTGERENSALLTGALISGGIAAALIFLLIKKTKLKFDAALATVMSVFFGAGTVLMTVAQKLPNAAQAGIEAFIYGQASSVLKSDVILILICGAVMILITLLLWKEFKLFCFDRDFASQLGFRCEIINFVLSFLTVVTIMLGIRIAGAVLMSAIMIAPAAAARQWCERLWLMVTLAALFGGMSGYLGAYFSSAVRNVPTGPAIAVFACSFAVLSILFAPKRGIIFRAARSKGLFGKEKL